MYRSTALLVLFVSIPFILAGETSRAVSYPDGYRAWTHIKSMVINPGHSLAYPFEGIHHVYANKKAMRGLADSKFSNGAIFVFDLLAQKVDETSIQEAERKFIGVMQYDRKRFASTGGWGFEVFAGNGQQQGMVEDSGEACFACHAAAKDTAYVFSRYRE